MKVAIIIVNYNGLVYLPDCLNSLSEIDFPKHDYQIFFVDNNSVDESVNYVKENYKEVKIIENPDNYGFAKGNNVGIQEALEQGFDYVLLINQDTVSAKDFLTKLVALAESDESIAAVQPRIMLHPETHKINSIGNIIHYLGFGYCLGGYQEYANDYNVKQICYASGAAVLIKSKVLKKIGLFDPEFFMYHEDLDLGWRMRLAGYKIFIEPQAVVSHKYEFSRSIKKYFYMERNRFICLFENYKLATLVLIFPALLIMEMGLFVFSLKSGFWKEKLKVYAYFFKKTSWQRIFKQRQKKQTERQVKDREIIKHFTGKIDFQEINNFVLNKIANPIFDLYWQIIKRIIIW